MLPDEGKLITLERPSNTAKAQASAYPMSALPFYFHVVPETYSVSASPQHASQFIVRYGEISQFGGPGLKTVSWDGMFAVRAWFLPDEPGDPTYDELYPPWVQEPHNARLFYDAFESIDILEQIRDQGLIVKLNILDLPTQAKDIADLPCTIRQFEWGETAGEPDMRTYSISFTQYRPVRLRKVPRVGALPPSGRSRKPAVVKEFYTVPKESMGIREIARAVYRKTDRTHNWKTIRDLNGGLPGMHRLHAEHRPSDKDGPWFFSRNTKLRVRPARHHAEPSRHLAPL